MTGKNCLDEMLMWDTWATELQGGIPVLQSLNLLKEAFPAYSEEILALHDSIKEGDSMSVVLDGKYSKSFHPLIAPLILVGENTGDLVSTLKKGSEIMEKELELGKKRNWGNKKELNKVMFFHYLNALTDAGLPILRSINVLRKAAKYPPEEVIASISEGIESGNSLAASMAQHPKYFSHFDLNLIRAGEAAGALEVNLKRLAENLEKKYFTGLKYGQSKLGFFSRLFHKSYGS